RGARRPVTAHQGGRVRAGRRDRLCHRRGRSRRVRGVRGSPGASGRDGVSDRRARRGTEPERCREVRGVRHVGGRPVHTLLVRIRRTLSTAPDRKRHTARPPAALVVLGCLGLALFVVPLVGLLGRVPWSDLPALLATDVVTDALRLSLVASLAATAISFVLGLPLAWVLARTDFPGRRVVRGVVVLPLVLPPVV